MLFFYNKMSRDQNAPLFQTSSPVLDISRRLSTKNSGNQTTQPRISKDDDVNSDSILEMMISHEDGCTKEGSDGGSDDEDSSVMGMEPVSQAQMFLA